jgi:phosphoribosylformimino-5-aminoimidazole carboxamide ribotide isomerase
MILYPVIQLQKGRAVALNRGRIDEPHIWPDDPVEAACRFAAAGAEWLHVTDLDAVMGGDWQDDLITRMIREARIPVQLGGGFRSAEGIERWIDKGIGRAVVSTLATREPALVKAAAKRHPDQIVLSVDVFRGKVLADGWTTESTYSPKDFIGAFADDPLAAVVITDIDVDIADTELSLALITELAGLCRSPAIASGVVQSLDDVSRVAYVPHVSGALVGRALFNGSVDLREALKIASHATERTAEFI